MLFGWRSAGQCWFDQVRVGSLTEQQREVIPCDIMVIFMRNRIGKQNSHSGFCCLLSTLDLAIEKSMT